MNQQVEDISNLITGEWYHVTCSMDPSDPESLPIDEIDMFIRVERTVAESRVFQSVVESGGFVRYRESVCDYVYRNILKCKETGLWLIPSALYFRSKGMKFFPVTDFQRMMIKNSMTSKEFNI